MIAHVIYNNNLEFKVYNLNVKPLHVEGDFNPNQLEVCNINS